MAVNGGISGIIRKNVQDKYARRNQIADALLQQASSSAPVYSIWEGLAKLGTAGLAGWQRSRNEARQAEDEKGAFDTLAKALASDKGVDYNTLASNPFTSGLATELKVQDLENERDRQSRRSDALFSQGLQVGQDGQVGFIPGYLESQEKIAGLKGGATENWMDVLDPKGKIIGQRSSKTGQYRPIDAKQDQMGPFQGNALDAQVMNLLLTGDPGSPEYLAAYNYLRQPKTQIIDGQEVKITPDVSAFRAPTSLQQSSAQQPSLSQAQGQGNSNISVQKIDGLQPTFTQETKQAADFANRLEVANNILSQLEREGITSMSYGGQLASQLGDKLGFNIRDPKFQQQDQAIRSFINATLRRESGATITPQEFENAKLQYFPQPGDSSEVIAQKAKNRMQVIQGMITQAGKAYQPLNTQKSQQNTSSEPGKVLVYDPKTRTFKPE